MKVLFFMRSTVYVRNFESTLRTLAERGHDVHVVADRHFLESDALIERLCAAYPGIHHTELPIVPFDAWSFFGREVRAAMDYLRYLGREFEHAPRLRIRAQRNAPQFALSVLETPGVNTRVGRRLLARSLQVLDASVPCHPDIQAFVRDHAPDLVLVTPLVEPGSPQSEYVRAARALGIPVGLCVYSWDNLTNKGLIHDRLDVVTVWNDAMKAEAVRLHHIPGRRVEVTGAAAYDHWFAWRPREPRKEFCARVGLSCDRPYLMYVCSSSFIAPKEVDYIHRWIAELRASSERLRDVGVLVRPHPQNLKEWKSARLTDLEHVAVWPPLGANPTDEDSRSGYYDSMYHSAAVVGVNTSALIESAIIGRSVYTLLAPEFRNSQEGTLHFHHLLQANGGVVHVAHTMEEQAAQLEAAICQPHDDDCHRPFVGAFVRPHGIHVPATPHLVAALERTGAQGKRRPYRGPWYGRLVRAPFAKAAANLARTDVARKEKADRQTAVKQRREAARAAGRARVLEARSRAAEFILPDRSTMPYATYLKVRDWLRALSTSNGTPSIELSAVERQMVARLAHLWDAMPETISAIRQWCDPISGIRPADYCADSELLLRLKRDVAFLRRHGGEGLFVKESSVLGGFGFRQRHGLYNEDTLRFYKALTALNDAAVLPEFRGNSQRRIAWEIGGGWGGFAYQFKTVCPNVTYLITGLPETLLVSAVYLMTAFPEAQFRFYQGQTGADLWKDWQSVEFILAPESAVPQLTPPRVDLVLDMMTLRSMTEARVALHVQRAFEFGARYFYSVEPGRIFPTELPTMWRSIQKLYWPHIVPPRLDASHFMLKTGQAPAVDDYAHLVGWRRIRPVA